MQQPTLFTNLKRLFSSDVIIRNIGGSQLKVVDINQIQSTGKYQTNALMDRFSRLYMYNNTGIFNPNINYQTLRTQLYSDYEAMDTDAIIASALDILADETTIKNDQNEILSIRSSDENMQKVLYNLFYDVLNIPFNLWSWVRDMCKYGDHFLKLEIAEEFGVYNVIPYTVYHMSRHEGINESTKKPEVKFRLDPDGLSATSDPNYLNKPSSRVIEFDNYEIAHFRLISNTSYLPYGRSYLEPGRKLFKQMVLAEDAMLIHRIMRAPEKRVFYINVGQIPPHEVEQFMQQQITQLKKTPYVDPQTGQYNLKFNMMNMIEDFYLPVRGGDTSTKVETTKGLDYDGTQDVSYLRDKLFAALKIPKAYLGYEGELQGKSTLAGEDIRFSRTVERIQRIVESELTKIALIHLYVQGFRGESLTNFELILSSPSIIFEQEKVALLQEKINLAEQMISSKLFSSDYIYNKIFGLSEDQILEQRELVREDYKNLFRISQIENEGNDPAQTGRTYGTPHDLASIYGRRKDSLERGSSLGEVPLGYEDDPNPPDIGRPKEKVSIYNTNKDPFGGRDKLGVHGLKGGYPSDNENVQESKQGDYLGHKTILYESSLDTFNFNNEKSNLPLDSKYKTHLKELLNNKKIKEKLKQNTFSNTLDEDTISNLDS